MTKTREVSFDYLKNLALFYCSKRETSRKNLERYLHRKCLLPLKAMTQPERLQLEPQIQNWIKQILDSLESKNSINDQRYGQMLVDSMSRKKKGKKVILQKLNQKGVLDTDHLTFKNEAEEKEMVFELALKYWEKIKKQRIGRTLKDERTLQMSRQNKLVQKLLSQGYDYDLIKNILKKVVSETDFE
jgi:regulatory protein